MDGAASCRGPSTSLEEPRRLSLTSSTASTSKNFIEAPAFFYDVDSDLKDLKSALRSTEFLQDSGYQSGFMDKSYNPLTTSFIEDISDDEEEETDWDGYLSVGQERLKIKDMSDILASRYTFLSGARTNEGLTVVTFPDARTQLSFEDYQLLITYLLQVPPLEESHKGFVIVADKRNDKWASVRTMLLYISSFFPGQIRLVLLLKPEGVLQRALEVGYRGVAENCSFKVIYCESSLDLRRYLRAEQLTMDVGGLIKYNHLEWVQHRMDIERMKSSASIIAQSLADFGRTLRETELPNDVETTARILNAQTAEKDAIKEDFRIAVRKGMSLLKSVRQLETKPKHEQLSPTRLHNVTAIERMLIQLEETERSFDSFWSRHETRLTSCLQLRQFEDSFRKLQSTFARHMLYLEEHREVGDGVEAAQDLAKQHELYAEQAMDDVATARQLRDSGEEIMSTKDEELSGSLMPKCDELERMAEALTGALERRAQVLRLSSTMHSQIQDANLWCKRGVEMLTSSEMSTSASSGGLSKLDEFLEEGSKLQLDALSSSPTMNNMILLTTTETSTLLAQVAERIDDIRRMSVARRDALAKSSEQKRPPIQIVTPEKKKNPVLAAVDNSQMAVVAYSNRWIGQLLTNYRILHDIWRQQHIPKAEIGPSTRCCTSDAPSTSPPQTPHSMSIESFVVSELLTTERSYVNELEQLLEHYVEPFDTPENQHLISAPLRGRPELAFGNLRELLLFHSRFVLPDLESNENSPSAICRTFLQHRHRFLALYYSYCQNKATNEVLRKEMVDNSPFFLECQRRAGHMLPLGAYLLKPVQRITKYQLLLRELERHCRPEVRPDVGAALSAMLDLLTQINAAIHQLHISGFNGDLRLLGALRLQSECDVFAFSRKKKSKLNRAQRRHLFLFDGGVLFCKKRSPPSGQPTAMDPEFFEHKMCIPTSSLGFSDASRTGLNRFEVWDEAKIDAFAVEPVDPAHRERWINRLGGRLDADFEMRDLDRSRPKSWISTTSNESSCSQSTRTSDDSHSMVDSNGNTQTATMFGSPSLSPVNSPDHVVPTPPGMKPPPPDEELVEEV